MVYPDDHYLPDHYDQPHRMKDKKPSKMRISKIDYYLEIARAVAKRSTCLRRQYGAVIVKNDEIIATGYNGSARGEMNCCDLGECWREKNAVPHGEQYEKCVAVHAEQNAIISASRKDMIGATMYLAGFENGKEIIAIPCLICQRMIVNAGIKSVVCIAERPEYCTCGLVNRHFRKPDTRDAFKDEKPVEVSDENKQ